MKRAIIETSQVTDYKDKKGQKHINEFTVLQKLGEGSFGTVKLCRSPEGLFAMKVFKVDLLRRRREFHNSPEVTLS